MQRPEIAANRSTDVVPDLVNDDSLPRDAAMMFRGDDCCVGTPRPVLYDMAAPTESDASKSQLTNSPRTEENAAASSYGLRQTP